MSVVRAPVDLAVEPATRVEPAARPLLSAVRELDEVADVADVAEVAAATEPAASTDTRELPEVPVRPHGRATRAFELLVATTALVALAPVLGLIALVVATTSRGPVFYRQERIGVGGRPFEIVKFRTMRVGAEELAEAVFSVHDDGSGPLNKRRDDPRVTVPGRWLRRYSLDELPQLWNVVNGTMALVGPRPSIPREVARFTALDHARHAVRPGITGMAQVSGRSDLDWDAAVRLDLYYAEHRSLWLDIRILLRTVPAVVRARGAY